MKWMDRFARIISETDRIPDDESSSRYLHNRRFWDAEEQIQPGKVVGWILSVEEHGERIKE